MKILDSRGQFLQKWNKIFVWSCVLAVFLDLLFLYIPVIVDDKKCLRLDKNLQTAAIVLRSFSYLFYMVHMIFQFRTGFIVPSSQVFGRGELVKDASIIARRYLCSNFFIDILAVLPLPQAVVLLIIPLMGGSRSLNTMNLLKFVVLFQYVPRVLRVHPVYKEATITSGIFTKTAWSGAALNLFLYMLAGHKYLLQSTATRLEEWRVKMRDAEQWMSTRLLPENLRERISDMNSTNDRKLEVLMKRI